MTFPFNLSAAAAFRTNAAIVSAVYAVLAGVRSFLEVVIGGMALIAAAAGVYLAKSALGINVFAWQSPLHDLLYHFVR
jgi:cell shape-determining protein MreD